MVLCWEYLPTPHGEGVTQIRMSQTRFFLQEAGSRLGKVPLLPAAAQRPLRTGTVWERASLFALVCLRCSAFRELIPAFILPVPLLILNGALDRYSQAGWCAGGCPSWRGKWFGG